MNIDDLRANAHRASNIIRSLKEMNSGGKVRRQRLDPKPLIVETTALAMPGAEAAVARINLDGAPPPGLLDAIQDGNRDILDLHLVTI